MRKHTLSTRVANVGCETLGENRSRDMKGERREANK